MRIVADDVVPGLAMLTTALPRPWVLPNTATRAHRDRLVRLVHATLRGAQPELRLGELRWGERGLVARLALPPRVLIRWRIDPLPGVDRAAIMREAQAIHPGPALYDFGRAPGSEALAWLGPLKLEVLHRIIDAFSDTPPVKEAEQVIERLHELAAEVRSPVELIDAAETMVEAIVLGQTVRSAHAEACARLIVGAFDDEDDLDAADIIEALAGAHAPEALEPDARVLLERVGLLEPGAPRPPMLVERLAGDDVMPRVQRLVLARFPLTRPVQELAADLDETREPGLLLSLLTWSARKLGTLSASLVNAIATSDDDLATPPRPQSRTLQAALTKLETKDPDAAARQVLDALRSPESQAWSREDALSASRILSVAASSVELSGAAEGTDNSILSGRRSALLEVAADLALMGGDIEACTEHLFEAASHALSASDHDRSSTLLDRAAALIQPLDVPDVSIRHTILVAYLEKQRGNIQESRAALERAASLLPSTEPLALRAHLAVALGQAYGELADTGKARILLHESLAWFREDGDRDGEQLALLHLGLAEIDSNQQDAEQHFQQALALEPSGIWLAHIHFMLGVLRTKRDDLSEARQEIEQAFELYSELGNANLQGLSLYSLGKLDYMAGDLASSRSLYEAAIELLRSSGDTDQEGDALLGLGHVLRDLGDLDGARSNYARSLSIARTTEDRTLEAKVLQAQGALYFWPGDAVSCQALYEQAAAILDPSDATPGATDVDILFRNQIALAAIHLAQGHDASEYVNRSMRLANTVQFAAAQTYCDVVATALVWTKDPAAADQRWSEAARYFRRAQRKASATLASALAAVARDEPLDLVAEYLAQTFGTMHPLPDRVRTSTDPDQAVRAIIAFLAA